MARWNARAARGCAPSWRSLDPSWRQAKRRAAAAGGRRAAPHKVYSRRGGLSARSLQLPEVTPPRLGPGEVRLRSTWDAFPPFPLSAVRTQSVAREYGPLVSLTYLEGDHQRSHQSRTTNGAESLLMPTLPRETGLTIPRILASRAVALAQSTLSLPPPILMPNTGRSAADHSGARSLAALL